MKRIATLIGVCICTLMFGIAGPAGAASCGGSYDYNYVSLDDAKPSGSTFVDYFHVTDSRDVYGTSYVCDVNCVPSIVISRNGVVTVLHSGAIGYSANERGVVGGSVLTDPDNFIEQAALFEGSIVHLIPRLPNELTSRVAKVTNSGIALVVSVDATSGASTLYLVEQGSTVGLNLGSSQVGFLDINDSGAMSGTYFDPGPSRGFRYSPTTGTAEKLEPLPTEPESWAQAINSKGEVLGYSFVAGSLERIGFWHKDKFHTSFVEGTPEFPTVSNSLLWNEQGLIVITRTNDSNSYIVPRPGVRLNLADLTTGLPVWTSIVDVNNNGDLLGQGGSSAYYVEHGFLLERTCTKK